MSPNTPCAACKHFRQKCEPNCLLAPYFPPNSKDFEPVHKVFGKKFIKKRLEEIDVNDRHQAVRCMAFEAKARLQDPVMGAAGIVLKLSTALNIPHTLLNIGISQEILHDIQLLVPEIPQHQSTTNVGLTGPSSGLMGPGPSAELSLGLIGHSIGQKHDSLPVLPNLASMESSSEQGNHTLQLFPMQATGATRHCPLFDQQRQVNSNIDGTTWPFVQQGNSDTNDGTTRPFLHQDQSPNLELTEGNWNASQSNSKFQRGDDRNASH